MTEPAVLKPSPAELATQDRIRGYLLACLAVSGSEPAVYRDSFRDLYDGRGMKRRLGGVW